MTPKNPNSHFSFVFLSLIRKLKLFNPFLVSFSVTLYLLLISPGLFQDLDSVVHAGFSFAVSIHVEEVESLSRGLLH